MSKLSQATEGKWDVVFDYYGIPITKGNTHYKGPCPLCGKEGKFRLYKDWIRSGGYVCVCSSSPSGVTLLLSKTGKSYKDLAVEIYKMLNYDEKEVHREVKQDNGLKEVQDFNMLPILNNSYAEMYLLNRGIKILPHKAIRFSPACFYTRTTNYPAMVALATTDSGEVAYKHCTYVLNGQKIDRDDAKKMFKVQNVFDNSICIRMFNLGKLSYMGIAEGIETALSAAQMFDLPVWATMNSTYMKKFKAPKGIKDLFIYADNDRNGTGLHAAFECGRNNVLAPNDVERVHIFWPREHGDFNDVLRLKIGYDLIRWDLTK